MIRKYYSRFVCILAVLAIVAGTAAFGQSQRFDFPKVGNYYVLRGDFHMHTINSDGSFTTRDRVEESKELGYDVIAITDHGRTRAYRVAKYLGDQLGLIVIRGHETGMNKGEHYVVLGVDSTYTPIDSHRWARNRGEETIFYQDAMKDVAKHGGIIIWAHPHTGLNECTIWGAEQGIIVGVELKNDVVGEGWNTEKSHGTSWYPSAVDWALKYNWAMLACTDAHGKRKQNPAVTLVFAKERSEQGVLEAIRARRTIAWFDGMLWGRKELLSELMSAMVKAERTPNGKLVLKNLGPVDLDGEVQGATGKVFDLKPYGETVVDPPDKTLTIRWLNVWYGLKENLTRVY
ncbi:MAG: CehA/McbA family metallohydrolase [Armatimonadota bacterium]|nr:CehA/McbA family metallohydrolase [Armatimonadota bacterium]